MAANKSPRRRAREFVLQGLYQWLVGGQDQATIEGQVVGVTGFDKTDQTLYRALLTQTLDHALPLQQALAPPPQSSPGAEQCWQVPPLQMLEQQSLARVQASLSRTH